MDAPVLPISIFRRVKAVPPLRAVQVSIGARARCFDLARDEFVDSLPFPGAESPREANGVELGEAELSLAGAAERCLRESLVGDPAGAQRGAKRHDRT